MDTTLAQEAQALLVRLEDIHRRCTRPDNDWEAYNAYWLPKIEDLIIQAQARLYRRERKEQTNAHAD